jgi:hypothetical protein
MLGENEGKAFFPHGCGQLDEVVHDWKADFPEVLLQIDEDDGGLPHNRNPVVCVEL